MLQAEKKRPFLSPRMQVILGIGVIIILIILAFIRPLERDPNEPLSVTNLVATQKINRDMQYKGVAIKIEEATMASKFSDDRKSKGKYVIRVMMQVLNNGDTPVGIDFSEFAQLVLPGGEIIEPKLVSLLPPAMPKVAQQGYLDFPVETEVPLSELVLRFENNTTIPFKA